MFSSLPSRTVPPRSRPDWWTGRRLQRRLAVRWASWRASAWLMAALGRSFFSFLKSAWADDLVGTLFVGWVDDLKVGDVRAVPEGKFYLTRVPEGYFALQWKCTHLGCLVHWMPHEKVAHGDDGFAAKGRFRCPCHCATFNRTARSTADRRRGLLIVTPSESRGTRSRLRLIHPGLSVGSALARETRCPLSEPRANSRGHHPRQGHRCTAPSAAAPRDDRRTRW